MSQTNNFRRKIRKQPKRRPRRVVKKQLLNPLRAGVPNSNRMCRFKLEYYLDVAVQGVVGINTPQMVFPLNFPGYGIQDNGVGTSTYGVLATAGLNGSQLFKWMVNTTVSPWSEYRVLNLKVVYIPNSATTTGGAVSPVDSSKTSNLLYHYNDISDPAILPVGTIDAQMLNDGIKPIGFADGRPKTFIMKQNKEKKKFYMSMTAINTTPSSSFTSLTNAMPNPFGAMKLAWSVYNPQAAVGYCGRVYVTYDVIFRGVDSTSIV